MMHCLTYQLQTVSLRLGGKTILQDLDLTVTWGEKVAIIGPSGAGKSSLLKLLNGALMPTRGDLKILDQSILSLRGRQLRLLQRQIGTIYQQFHLINDLRVVHNVNAGNLARWPVWKSLLSLLYPLEISRAASTLELVGMSDHLWDITSRLSGGQQQRVAIARVLIQNPTIVLADEPVSSLDPRLSETIMELLISLLASQPRTLITSLHDVALAKQYCDRIIGLKSGKILFDLPSDSVLTEHLGDLFDRGPHVEPERNPTWPLP